MRSLVLVLFASALMGQQHYDLGAPCVQDPALAAEVQLQRAEKAGAWDQAVEFAKETVRGGCSNEYRWHHLANALVEANRRAEAIDVLTEMDARGFDMSPSAINANFEGLRKFIATPEFLSSDVGMKFGKLKRVSDERRLRFRATLAKLPASLKPPDHYVAKGTCPFECCTYREWTVEQDTDLLAAPGSAQIVGRAKKGTSVRGMTGEVHLQPQPVVLLQDGPFPKDGIAFVLDYEGEGYAHVWSRGAVASVFLGVRDYCFQVSDSCWGETLFPSNQRKATVWWVKIRLPDGTIGWSDKADHFGNKDQCG